MSWVLFQQTWSGERLGSSPRELFTTRRHARRLIRLDRRPVQVLEVVAERVEGATGGDEVGAGASGDDPRRGQQRLGALGVAAVQRGAGSIEVVGEGADARDVARLRGRGGGGWLERRQA